MEHINIKFNIGDIVYSRAGRDKGRYYVVMWVKENFIGICDGEIHKVDKIKKKKCKHVLLTGKTNEYIKEKIFLNKKIINAEIKKIVCSHNFDE
ncbi:MAG: RNA-binding protein [Clostridiales bacterium]|jgi:ribosomal protein L14E/L6E/L27E|nr:RNA-binding protein [Clostridiales bacterium]